MKVFYISVKTVRSWSLEKTHQASRQMGASPGQRSLLFPSTAALSLGAGGFLFDGEERNARAKPAQRHLHPPSPLRAPPPLQDSWAPPAPPLLWVLSPSGGCHADGRLPSPVSSLTVSWVSPAAFVYKSVLKSVPPFTRDPTPSPSTFALFPSSPSQPCFSKHDLHFWILPTLALTSLSPHVIVITCWFLCAPALAAFAPTPEPVARAVFSVPHPTGKRTPSPQHPLGTLGSAEFLPQLEHPFLILVTDVPQAPRSPLLCHPLGPQVLWYLSLDRVMHCPSSDRQCLVPQLLAHLSSCQGASPSRFPHRKQNGLFQTQAGRAFPA